MAEPVSESTGVPAWLWWLLAAVLLALAAGIPLLLAARRRRTWAERLEAATAEAAWFARSLIPQLQQQPSSDQVAGGWRVARDRVAAAEDALTGLVATAPHETDATRAVTLRDAVRSSKDRLDALVQTAQPATSTTASELATAATTLEAALAPPNPNPPSPKPQP